MDRKRLVIIASVLVFTAFFWWLSTLFSLGQRPLVTGAPRTPDYIIDGMHVTHMDKRGRKKFELRADTLSHYPEEKLARLRKVYLVQYEENGIQVHTSADRARYPDDGSELFMEQNVHIVRRQNGKVVGDIRANTTHITLGPESR